MAEVFSNYLVSKSFSTGNQQIIVPKAGEVATDVTGTRTSGSTTQIHSVYITQHYTQLSSDPESNAIIGSVFIKNTTNNKVAYLAYNVKIVPHSSFYIEKTITLTPQDQLWFEYSSLNTTSTTVSIVSSGVDIT